MSEWNTSSLNAEQVAAIEEPSSVFLVACPGSGKTQTLTFKIAKELSKSVSDKQWISAITYTHRAADEIHDRIEALGVDTSRLWIGTIHSFCLEWILRPYGIYHDALKYGFSVINSHDTEQILTRLCAPYAKERISYWDCSGQYYTPAGRTLTCPQGKRAAVTKILDEYESLLNSNRQVDFELILKYAHDLMSQTPLIGSLLGAIFSCILVDEYQDTKEIQYSLIASILRNGKGATSAFVVGDPNQAIYGSLGGCAIDPKTFGKWAGVSFKEMQLSKNYRSSARVIEYFGNYNVHATKISAAGKQKNFPSVISFEKQTQRKDLDAEIARLIRYNVEKVGIAPGDVCVVAPQWLHLASMTRRLVNLMPEYSFDGPGMVPFARDYDNFWYKVSKVVLTEASPHMYVRRLRWAKDILSSLDAIGIDTEEFSPKVLLRICNSISIVEEDGLTFLGQAFDFLLGEMGIELKRVQMLSDHHKSFFDSSRDRVARLKNEGTECVGELKNFRKAFENRNGVTISTIHGVKGAEYDAVIAFSLLEGMVPHFSDPDRDQSAKRLLYVICSRARKNVHLISELGRLDGRKNEYTATCVLDRCRFKYDKV